MVSSSRAKRNLESRKLIKKYKFIYCNIRIEKV